MVNDKDQELQELALEIIKSDYAYVLPGVGLFFDEHSIPFDRRYSHIVDHKDYPIIRQKVKKIFKLCNATPELVDKDFETELWHMV